MQISKKFFSKVMPYNDEIYFAHIYRNKNSRADELSNIAIKDYVELQNQK